VGGAWGQVLYCNIGFKLADVAIQDLTPGG
jgi:hypothetical protein